MGHDIYAKNPKDTSEDYAYLRRGAFSKHNYTIYDALDAHKHNGGVSGYGTEEVFTRGQILEGLERLKGIEGYSEGELDPEKTFLEKCLPYEEVLIDFS